MNQEIRNKLRNVVTQCRKLLEDSITQDLEGKFGIYAKKENVTADPNAPMTHLSDEEKSARKDILDHFEHIRARGFKPKDALDQLIREIAFTHLNRFCAYKMMEAREVYVGGQKFRESVSRGFNSNGVKFYLADHPEDERLFNTGHQHTAYCHFLDWLGEQLSEEIGVLFNPNDSANRLYPRQSTLDEVLDLLNTGGIKPEETELREAWPTIWSSDETIGWVYQYFTPKELRDKARKESQAPRNPYELGFRNQFFTPRYVVQFLTDNTLGRMWYEMSRGETKLIDQCEYMVRRPTELFLKAGQESQNDGIDGQGSVSKEEALKLPFEVPCRAKKDPRSLKILDPACGSGHFLLYCFDLLLTIYEEAYNDCDLGPALQKEYPNLEDLQKDIPRLILAENLHGIDIDLRATQIAALALWLRCQRSFKEMGLKKDRPRINRTNCVCAEPMPGEDHMLKEFIGQLEPKLLGQLVEVIFDKMKLAGESGSLLKVEEEIRDAVAAAKKQWLRQSAHAEDRRGQPLLFTQAAMDALKGKVEQDSLFDLNDITDDQFFEQAEVAAVKMLSLYAQKAKNEFRLRRRLFTDDAEQGFAFIDLCHKRYDVVLMNPPFGAFTPLSKRHAASAFPLSCHDIFASFIECNLSRLVPGGCLGAITSRAAFFTTSFTEWRKQLLLAKTDLDCFVDLGDGVMDAAVVEAAAYVLRTTDSSSRSCPRPFFRLLRYQDKAAVLASALADFRNGRQANNLMYLANPQSFTSLSEAPFAYWVHLSTIAKLSKCPSFEPTVADVRKGLRTGDNFRFVRTLWEVSPSEVTTKIRSSASKEERNTAKWVPFVLSGASQPWYSPTIVILKWHENGAELRNYVKKFGSPSRLIQAEDYYFRPGFSWTRRAVRFVPYAIPAGSIHSGSRPMAFPSEMHQLTAVAVSGSRVASAFMRMYGEKFAFPNFLEGKVKKMPWPHLTQEQQVSLDDFVREQYKKRQDVYRGHEPFYEFIAPFHVRRRSDQTQVEINWQSLLDQQAEVEIASGLGLTEEESSALCIDLDEALTARDVGDEESEGEEDDSATEYLLDTSAKGESEAAISYAVGSALGRWDLRYATGEMKEPPLRNPFEPLPSLPLGMLCTEEGIAATETPDKYHVEISWEGILSDDREHKDDIVSRVRRVLEVIWKDKAELTERRICESLRVKTLRDYFRKSSKGGFWDDHIARYSKSRRKAPIYWLLQSAKKNYSLWLYYPRLDRDLLFKALINYVEPKIRLESNRLDLLRSQRTSAGDSSRESKRLENEIETQDEFISELIEFEGKLRKVANFHLVPDLDDGVVLNIAPLHEVVPWKEAKSYWTELLEGKYEWSSIGKQLRQKGLVR